MKALVRPTVVRLTGKQKREVRFVITHAIADMLRGVHGTYNKQGGTVVDKESIAKAKKGIATIAKILEY